MRRLVARSAFSLFALLLLGLPASAQDTGAALQLYSYGVTPATQPNVTDGQIAANFDPADWQSAYVRVLQIGIDGNPANDPRPMTLLVANDETSLYIAAAVQLPNASQNNRLTLYFDQATAGLLDGAPGAPGEYYVTALADGTAPADGHWDGSSWVANSATAIQGIGLRKGTSAAERLYNFEFVMPLSQTGDAANSYLDLLAGDEVGIFPMISLNTGDSYYWLDTNDDPTDPSAVAGTGEEGWGRLRTLDLTSIADRNVVSLAALTIQPTIDGDISGDDDWRFSFKKDILLTDLAGRTLDATLRLKESHDPDNLLLGMTIEGLTPAPGDHFAVYFDDGEPSGDRDFRLTDGGDVSSDNAARVTGSGAYQDWHFDSNTWVGDVGSHGAGAATVSPGGDWEIEMSVPFSSGDVQDMGIVPDDELGALLQYYDSATGRSFWWTATINDNERVIDPVDPVHNALGWGFLQTGGPFIQPIYPEPGDILSGEFPLAVYALDPSDPDPGQGIEWIRYEVRRLDPQSGTYVLLHSGDLTRITDPTIPIWTATLNTADVNVSPGDPVVLIYEVYDGEVDPVSVPLDVFIDNSGSTVYLDDPEVTVDAPAANDVIAGTVSIEYSAATNEFLSLDTVELIIDGAVVATDMPDSSGFAGIHDWDTSLERDGEHVIQVRASNSLGFESVSPATVVVVDNTAPEISDVAVTYPAGQVMAAAGQEVVVSALVTDAASALDAGSVMVMAPDVDAASATGMMMVDDGTNGDAVAGDNVFTATLTVTQTASGDFNVTVGATDVVGNAATVMTSVALDNDAPVFTSVSVFGPDNIYANGETVSLTATLDAPGYEVTADFVGMDDTFIAGAEVVEDMGNGTYRITYAISPSNQTPNGTYTIPITATDPVGLSATETIDLVLDNSGPVVTALALDDADDILNSDDLVLATVEDDDNQIQAAEFFVDVLGEPGEGTAMVAADGTFDDLTEGVSALLAIGALDEGQHTLYVRGQDVSGVWGPPMDLDFVVDRVPPAIQDVTVVYPEGQDAARDGQTIVFTALVTDETAGLDWVTLTAADLNAAAVDQPMFDDGSNGDAVAGDDVFTAMVEVDTGLTGEYPFTITATDIVPNSASVSSATVVLDNDAPAFVDLVVLDPDSLYADGETISLLATFDEAGYAVTADFSPIDDSFVAGTEDVEDLGDGTYRIRYTIAHTNGREDGDYAVAATATDEVGNTATGSVDLVLDNTGARVIALDLDDEDLILNSDAVIIATITDDDNVIQAAEYYVDVIGLPGEGIPMDPVDGTFDSMTEDVTAPLSIAALAEGQHTLYVRAQDVTGQWGPPLALDFLVDRLPPAIQNVTVVYPEGQVAARDGQTVLFTALVTDMTAGLNTDRVFLTAADVNAGAVDQLMVDDGTMGDLVAGDDVFTGAVEVNSGQTGVFQFTIAAEDIVPNATSRTGSVRLDNEMPTLSVDVQPAPRNGTGLSGEVYVTDVIIDGSYADVPQADFVDKVTIHVRNEDGHEVHNSPFVIAPTEDQFFSRIVHLVEGTNDVLVSVFDRVGNRTDVEFTLTRIPAQETAEVGSSGGTVTSPDGTSVTIPDGALLSNEEITIERFPVDELPKPLDEDVTLIGAGHRFGPEGLVFHEPIQIRLSYADADLDVDQDGEEDLEEADLAVFYWDGYRWIKSEASGRSVQENFVDVYTNHFSLYALGVDASDDDFAMYWTRNPFSANEGTTAVMSLPTSGEITLRIYDLGGDLVRTIADGESVTGSANRNWDGRNDFDSYVGSGIYIYVFEFIGDTGGTQVIRKPIGVVE